MTREANHYILLSIVTLLGMLVVSYSEPFDPPGFMTQDHIRPALGWSSLAFAISTLLYILRKRVWLQGAGTLLLWKSVHVVTGFIFVILWALHTNGSFGFGLQAGISISISLLVATGVYGIVQQGHIPGVMNKTLFDPVYKSVLQDEVIALMGKIEKSLAKSSDEFSMAYQRHILPYISIDRPDSDQQKGAMRRLFGREEAGRNAAIHDVKHLSAPEKEKFYEIAALTIDIIEIRRSQAYQKLMNRWLLWHIGATPLFLILVGFHIFAGFYY